MSKSCKNITKQILVASVAASLGVGPAFAIDNVQLRGSVNDSAPAIQLRNTIKIDQKNQTISLNLRDSDVKQVLRMLADKAGLNIVFHDSVSGKITLDLVNVSLNKAFEYVMTLNGLTYWQDNKTLIISSKNVAQGLGINRTEIKPIKIKYNDASMIVDFLNNNVFSYNRPDLSSANIAVANAGANEVIIFGNNNDVALAQKVIKYLDVKPSVKTFTISHGEISDIANKICKIAFTPSLSNNNNQGGSSGTAMQSAPMNNGTTIPTENKDIPTGSIVFCSSNTNTNQNAQNQNNSQQQSYNNPGSNNQSFSGIASTLKSLATPAFWVSGDYQLNQVTVYGGTEEQVKIAEDVVKKFDKKPPQAYMEISIIELTESGSKELSSNIIAHSKDASFGFNKGPMQVEYAHGSLHNEQGVGTILSNLNSYSYNKTLITSIQALIEQHKGKMLANPRIIATHGKTSVINISQDYVKTRKQETNASTSLNTIVSTNYEIADQGIKLDITPKISPDGYLSVDIKPSYTSVKEPVTEKGTDNLVATLLNKRDLELKNVRIKDGETLVLGGLIQETNNNKVYKIPVLGDMPIIGAFFKSTTTDHERSELIIMVTPKIIKDEGTVENI